MEHDLNFWIFCYKQNFNKEPILNKERLEELAKKMNVEIEGIFLHPLVSFEWWVMKVKAQCKFTESFYYDDLTMEIIGVNFDTKELLLDIRPK